jgi:hypothetical protein
MKKHISIALLCMVILAVFSGIMMSTVSADENYNDISNEYSDGPGEPPEDGMLREEPRTRFKDV